MLRVELADWLARESLELAGWAARHRTAPPTDFPRAPESLSTPATPPNAPVLFGGKSARTGSAPCIKSPQTSTLMPRNWLRPRFDYQPAADENLFEITPTVPGFRDSLRAYTRASSYTLDKPLWDRLRTSVNDIPIAVTVKALTLDGNGNVQLGVSETASTSFVVAPVDAPGKIVYWALANNVGSLKGFGIGEEGTEDVLVPSQVLAQSDQGDLHRLPCGDAGRKQRGIFAWPGALPRQHRRHPHRNRWNSTVLRDSDSAVGSSCSEGIPAYSAAHWSNGDRIAVASDTGDLHWIQLDGTAQGILSRAGDTLMATEPTFSHDGKTGSCTSRRARSSRASRRRAGRSLSSSLCSGRWRIGHTGRGCCRPVTTPSTTRHSRPTTPCWPSPESPGTATSTATAMRRSWWFRRREERHPPRRQRCPGLPAASAQPRPHQRLAPVVARCGSRQRQEVLLGDVLLAAVRTGPAVRDSSGRRRERDRDHLPGALPLEPASERQQPHAVVGRLPDSVDHDQLTAGQGASGCRSSEASSTRSFHSTTRLIASW